MIAQVPSQLILFVFIENIDKWQLHYKTGKINFCCSLVVAFSNRFQTVAGRTLFYAVVVCFSRPLAQGVYHLIDFVLLFSFVYSHI